jgi:hypothetical protein
MMFQLPTGKVIYLTVEEYLSLSDEDIQALIAGNLGDYPTSYWDGSVIKKHQKPEHVHKDIDYEEDSEEIIITTVSINTLTIDEIESMEDQDDSSEEDS